jgi:exosortase
MAETKVLNDTEGAKRRTNVGRRTKAAAKAPEPRVVAAKPIPIKRPIDANWVMWAAAIMAAGLWAYWPTLVEIVGAWNREADYSHGYLVVPAAILFLVARKGSYPGVGAADYPVGFALLGIGLLMRYLGALFFYEFVDGYSILFWLAGAVAILGGRQMLLWALPSIGFLFFMIPLPFGIETAMSAPLQRVATKLTCLALQTMGLAAFSEGNVVLIGEQRLEVAQACSGLRLFMTIVAVAYAYALLVRRAWWEKAILIAAVVPIAIASNATRIIATGLLFEYTTGEAAHKFAHDFAGFAMIGLAAVLFAGVLWYLSVLIREEEVLDMSVLVRESEA